MQTKHRKNISPLRTKANKTCYTKHLYKKSKYKRLFSIFVYCIFMACILPLAISIVSHFHILHSVDPN